MQRLTRRTVLASLAATPFLLRRAQARGLWRRPDEAPSNHLVVINLRGACDGLAALPPHADPAYRTTRGGLALPMAGKNSIVDLDGCFGLHRALAPLRDIFRRGEMLIMPATAWPDPVQAHEAGQGLLQAILPAAEPTPKLRNDCGAAAAGYDPAELDLIADLCRGRPRMAQDLLAAGPATDLPAAFVAQADGFRRRASELGAGLAAGDAPRLTMLESHGWDSHADQGTVDGRLAIALAGLAEGIIALAKASGPAWRRTTVLVITEFGRTAAMNRMGGTDHGRANATFLIGGTVAGGRVLGPWPGLRADQLSAGGGVQATTDLRAVIAAILRRHLDLADLTQRPMISASAGNLLGLFRA